MKETSTAMRPVRCQSARVIPLSPPEICAEIADVERWSEFDGYGPLPGIAYAEYERRTPDMVGSRICVMNEDGSQHVEEILAWKPGTHVVMQLGNFTPPLSRLASHFVEEWSFVLQENGTLVTRSVSLYPRRALARPFLLAIAQFFQRALDQHLAKMSASATN